MTKFEIKTDRFEIRTSALLESQSADEVFDWYMEQDANCPTIEAAFDTLEDARREFTKNYADYGRTYHERGNVGYLLTGRVAWIEQNEYDEDGEFDQGGDVWEFSAQPFSADDDE